MSVTLTSSLAHVIQVILTCHTWGLFHGLSKNNRPKVTQKLFFVVIFHNSVCTFKSSVIFCKNITTIGSPDATKEGSPRADAVITILTKRQKTVHCNKESVTKQKNKHTKSLISSSNPPPSVWSISTSFNADPPQLSRLSDLDVTAFPPPKAKKIYKTSIQMQNHCTNQFEF